jgi:hypothetical protein
MGRMKAGKVFLGMLRIRLPDKRLILELDAGTPAQIVRLALRIRYLTIKAQYML